jgi:hypothetical protein
MELEAIAQMGFSFAVTAWLLIENRGALLKNTEAQNNLALALVALKERISDCPLREKDGKTN